MALTRTKGCDWVESEIRGCLPSGWDVECAREFETENYVVFIEVPGIIYRRLDITTEQYKNMDWRRLVQIQVAEIEEKSSAALGRSYVHNSMTSV